MNMGNSVFRGTIKFSAGRLLWGSIRDFLRECQFKGLEIEWIESSGFIERDFIIKGPSDTLITIKMALDKWAEENKYK